MNENIILYSYCKDCWYNLDLYKDKSLNVLKQRLCGIKYCMGCRKMMKSANLIFFKKNG